jgi:hypothetical protein
LLVDVFMLHMQAYQDVQGSALVLVSWLVQAVTATMVSDDGDQHCLVQQICRMHLWSFSSLHFVALFWMQVLYMSNAVDNTPGRLIVLLAVADDLAAGEQVDVTC